MTLSRPQAMQRARSMYNGGEGGWSIHGIRNYLARNGCDVSWWTVKRWVVPEYEQQERDRQRDSQRQHQRQRRGTRAAAMRVIDDAAVATRVRELDGAHLSAPAISKVIANDYGVSLSAHQVRYMLDRAVAA